MSRLASTGHMKSLSITTPAILYKLYIKIRSVVVSARQDFFAAGTQEDGVFELRHKWASHIHERRVRVDDALIHQMSQSYDVSTVINILLRESAVFEPAAGKGQSLEIFIDMAHERLGFRNS